MQPNTSPPRLPPALLAGTVLLLAIPLIGSGVFLWLQWAALDAAWPAVTLLLRAVGFALLVGTPIFGGALIWRRWGTHDAVKADKVIALTRAQTQIAPRATTLTIQPQALPAPADMLQLTTALEVVKPLDAWMRWADEQPHILLAGKTKAGKTHLATAILERRLRAGERVFIIDPHASGWLNLPTAGGIANQNELKYALVALLAEYTARMQQREDHKKANNGAELPHDHFGRMTVLIDEANSIAELLSTVWSTFATQLASGSRKVGIALLVLAQSPNVEDIGFSAKMRNNFASIALDQATVQYLIDRERDKPRKIALREAAHDMDYPAAALIGPDTWLLDRSNLRAGTAPAGALSLMWGGWDYNQGRAVSRLSGETNVVTPLPPTIRIGNDVSEGVTSPEADSFVSLPVTVTHAEVAKIAILLVGNTPSEAAKKLDGYSPRKYAEYKAKVDAVKALLEEQTI